MIFLKNSWIPVIGLMGLGHSVLSSADEVAYSFTYQGRIMNTEGTAPVAESVDFTLGILNSIGTCLLYEETQRVDLSSTNGLFSVLVGSPTGSEKRSARDPGLALSNLFANKGTSIRADDGSSGTCPGGYQPVAGEGRILRVTVNSRSLGQITLTPDLTIASAPLAYVAETLQGLVPSDFAQQGKDANFSTVTVAPSGTVTLGKAPQQDLEAATKRYVDDKVTTVNNSVTALSGTLGTPSSVNNSSAVVQRDSSGNFSTNSITIVAPITSLSPSDVVINKGYVDNQLAALGSQRVRLAGDTMTGALILSGNPTDDNGAATKKYVDTAVAASSRSCRTYEALNPTENTHITSAVDRAGIDGNLVTYPTLQTSNVTTRTDVLTWYRMTCPTNYPVLATGGGLCGSATPCVTKPLDGTYCNNVFGSVRESNPQGTNAWNFSCIYPSHGEGMGVVVPYNQPAYPTSVRITCCTQ